MNTPQKKIVRLSVVRKQQSTLPLKGKYSTKYIISKTPTSKIPTLRKGTECIQILL